jgi:hypothetical protein
MTQSNNLPSISFYTVLRLISGFFGPVYEPLLFADSDDEAIAKLRERLKLKSERDGYSPDDVFEMRGINARLVMTQSLAELTRD